MPMFNFDRRDDFDPDGVPENLDAVDRPAVVVGGVMSKGGIELDFHAHRKSQLMLALQGVLTCEAERGMWIVPPGRALWVPGGVMHRVEAAGALEGYNVFVEPEMMAHLASGCCTVLLTPLLRELILRAASFPFRYPIGGAEEHLTTLLLDEIAAAPVESLHVPMPRDRRLRLILERLTADPSHPGTMAEWAALVALSERTLSRLVLSETGMSFGRWRQQLQIVLAIRRLATGASVQQVAFEHGYESAGSFVTMFRKATGAPPARFMSERSGRRPFAI